MPHLHTMAIAGLRASGDLPTLQHQLAKANLPLKSIRGNWLTVTAEGLKLPDWIDFLLDSVQLTRIDGASQQVLLQALDRIEKGLAPSSPQPVDWPGLRAIPHQLGNSAVELEALFIQVEEMSFGRYLSLRRLDKLKEWLVYSDCSLPDLAHYLGYESARQLEDFLAIESGLCAAYFRTVRPNGRRRLDESNAFNPVSR